MYLLDRNINSEHAELIQVHVFSTTSIARFAVANFSEWLCLEITHEEIYSLHSTVVYQGRCNHPHVDHFLCTLGEDDSENICSTTVDFSLIQNLNSLRRKSVFSKMLQAGRSET